MNLINRIKCVLNKHQTRQQLKTLTVDQLADIGKSHDQIKEELLKSALMPSLIKTANISLKYVFVGKMNYMLRSAK